MSDDKIVQFPGIEEVEEIDPDEVLKESMGLFNKVLVLGITKEGYEYFDCSSITASECNWIIDRAKKRLVSLEHYEEDLDF